MQNQLTTEQQELIIPELIRRFEARAKDVFNYPNPYIKPLFEKSEIESKIKELKLIQQKHGENNNPIR